MTSSRCINCRDCRRRRLTRSKRLGLFTGNRMGWFTVLFTLPFVGYLLFIKKYLRKG